MLKSFSSHRGFRASHPTVGEGTWSCSLMSHSNIQFSIFLIVSAVELQRFSAIFFFFPFNLLIVPMPLLLENYSDYMGSGMQDIIISLSMVRS